MTMMSKILARVRGIRNVGAYPEDDEHKQLHVNGRGDAIVTLGLPERTELVRLGGSWQVTIATGLAALTALPTTTGGLSLYNGEPANGKVYAIESFGSAEEVIDATQADTTAIFAMMNAGVVAAPTTGTALSASTFKSMSGVPNYAGTALAASGATVVNNTWFPHGQVAVLASAVAGAIWKVNEVYVNGLYMVRPGGQFQICAVKAAAAAAQQFYYIRWHEVQLPYV